MDFSVLSSSSVNSETLIIRSIHVTAQLAIVKQMTGRNRAAQLAIVKQMSRH